MYCLKLSQGHRFSAIISIWSEWKTRRGWYNVSSSILKDIYIANDVIIYLYMIRQQTTIFKFYQKRLYRCRGPCNSPGFSSTSCPSILFALNRTHCERLTKMAPATISITRKARRHFLEKLTVTTKLWRKRFRVLRGREKPVVWISDVVLAVRIARVHFVLVLVLVLMFKFWWILVPMSAACRVAVVVFLLLDHVPCAVVSFDSFTRAFYCCLI